MGFNPLRWVGNILLVADEAVNSLLGGAPDETISSRMGRWKHKKKGGEAAVGKAISGALDVIDKGHTDKVADDERRTPHRPESLNDEPGD